MEKSDALSFYLEDINKDDPSNADDSTADETTKSIRRAGKRLSRFNKLYLSDEERSPEDAKAEYDINYAKQRLFWGRAAHRYAHYLVHICKDNQLEQFGGRLLFLTEAVSASGMAGDKESKRAGL